MDCQSVHIVLKPLLYIAIYVKLIVILCHHVIWPALYVIIFSRPTVFSVFLGVCGMKRLEVIMKTDRILLMCKKTKVYFSFFIFFCKSFFSHVLYLFCRLCNSVCIYSNEQELFLAVDRTIFGVWGQCMQLVHTVLMMDDL